MTVLYTDFFAGWIGGACGTLIGHPLDTVKTIQQATNTKISSAVYEIAVKSKGFHGFYRGMTLPILTTGILNATLFGVYGNQFRHFQDMLQTDSERRHFYPEHIFISGCIAGLSHTILACPIELVKVRRQVGACTLSGSFSCMRDIVQREGFVGLYRGLTPMLCRDVLPFGIYMLSYNYTLDFLNSMERVCERKAKLRRLGKDLLLTRYEMSLVSIAGVVAGVLSWIFVIPFDVVKTIVQSETNSKNSSMIKCLKSSAKKDGYRSLFRGGKILIFRAIPVNAATFVGFEHAMEYFNKGDLEATEEDVPDGTVLR